MVSDNPKKKYMVYVKNEKGNVIKVYFGDPNMEIKRDNLERRKSYLILNKIKILTDQKQSKLQINDGDWVSLSKTYVMQHGKSIFNNKYKVLSKIVKASEVYTDGNSINEFGYNKD